MEADKSQGEQDVSKPRPFVFTLDERHAPRVVLLRLKGNLLKDKDGDYTSRKALKALCHCLQDAMTKYWSSDQRVNLVVDCKQVGLLETGFHQLFDFFMSRPDFSGRDPSPPDYRGVDGTRAERWLKSVAILHSPAASFSTPLMLCALRRLGIEHEGLKNIKVKVVHHNREVDEFLKEVEAAEAGQGTEH